MDAGPSDVVSATSSALTRLFGSGGPSARTAGEAVSAVAKASPGPIPKADEISHSCSVAITLPGHYSTTKWGRPEGTSSRHNRGNDSRPARALSSACSIRQGMRKMTQTRTLAIDIGGSGIKAALLDDDGTLIGDRQRVPTPPKPVAPEALVQAIDKAVAPLGDFERVSVGFPGYIRDGGVFTAPNLGSDVLAGFDLQSELARHWGKPVRVLNDADVQGFGAIEGHGVEMVLTLGTGAGTAIFRDGEITPHLEPTTRSS